MNNIILISEPARLKWCAKLVSPTLKSFKQSEISLIEGGNEKLSIEYNIVV